MTRKADGWTKTQRVVAVVAGLLAILGTVAGYTAAAAHVAVQVMEIERRPRVDSIADALRAEQNARFRESQNAIERLRAREDSLNHEILRRLDCALFDLPRDCRHVLAPR